jgi:dipeptidyl aminopeptidase/acylaminoacyl peptidase
MPVLLMHGDEDKAVPLKVNWTEFVARSKAQAAEGIVKLIVAKRQGHNFWKGFFRCQELVDFAAARAKAGREAKKEAD